MIKTYIALYLHACTFVFSLAGISLASLVSVVFSLHAQIRLCAAQLVWIICARRKCVYLIERLQDQYTGHGTCKNCSDIFEISC